VTVTGQLINAAMSLSTASLHEASGRHGALPSTLKPLSPSMHLSGRALPVRCPAGDNLWLHRALAQAEEGDVLVVDCGKGLEYGYWGEIMATAAVARGVAGLVICGGVRDSQALIALGLPTFSATVCIRGTGKDPEGRGSVGERVRIGQITINRGDLIVGDADGVLALSPEQAAEAIPAAKRRDQEEVSILAQVRAGSLTLDVYKL
jgi:4-hydroxy-4-methyl-2-oxoglutarate aldolase